MIGNEPITTALVTDWSKVPVENTAEGIKRQMIVGKNVMMCRFQFSPYLITPAHSHPHEQMTLVIQGKVRFTIGNEERIVSPGEVLHFPPDSWHGATMLDEEVVLIDIFSPIREDFLETDQGG